jgi:hypothetical protein
MNDQGDVVQVQANDQLGEILNVLSQVIRVVGGLVAPTAPHMVDCDAPKSVAQPANQRMVVERPRRIAVDHQHWIAVTVIHKSLIGTAGQFPMTGFIRKQMLPSSWGC